MIKLRISIFILLMVMGVGTASSEIANKYSAYLASRFAEQQQDYLQQTQFLNQLSKYRIKDDNFEQRFFLAALGAGDYTQALKHGQNLEDTDDRSLSVWFMAANYISSGDIDLAQKKIKEAGKSTLNKGVKNLFKAWLEAASGDYDSAFATLDGLSSQRIFNILATQQRAYILLSQGKWEEVRQTLFKAASKPDVELLPLNFFIIYLQTLIGEGGAENLKLAEKYIADRLEGNPQAFYIKYIGEKLKKDSQFQITRAPMIRHALANGLLQISYIIGNNLSNLSLYYARLAHYMELTNDHVTLQIASILAEADKYRDAMRILKRISKNSVKFFEAQLQFGDYLFDSGMQKESISFYKETLLPKYKDTRSIEYSEILRKLGYIYRTRKDFKSAKVVYQRMLKPKFGKYKTADWSTLYYLAITFERLKDWPKAEQNFIEALQLNPENPFILNYLGYTWVDKGINLKEALSMVERAVKQRSNDGFIIDSLGWALYKVGRYEESMKYMERAILLQPEDPVINDHLGDVYWRVGRKLEARYQWNHALSFNPDEGLEPEIRRKLKEGLNEKL